MAPMAAGEAPGSSPMEPSFDYRNSVRYWNVVCQTTCLTFSTVVVLLRLWTKFFLTRAPGWEDYTSAISWVGMIGYSVITLEADKHGSGIHQSQVAPDDLRRFAQLANASQITYGPLIFITKLSILLLYLRVFAPNRRSRTYYAVHFLLWFNLLFYTANTLVKIFQCTPREKIWSPKAPGRCVNVNLVIQTSAGLNVFSDFSLLLLPIVSVWRLQMKTSQKLGITAIFAAGLFGCLSSIMRLVIGIQKRATKDKTYDWFPEFLWTSAEITSGIIAACLPALPAFFRHYFHKAMTTFTGSSNHRTKSSSRPSYGKHSAGSSSNRRSRSTWPHPNPSDTDLLPGSFYMELDETKPIAPSGVVTTEIRAGSRPGSRDSPLSISSADAVGEHGQHSPRRTGILKTVHVEVETRMEER